MPKFKTHIDDKGRVCTFCMHYKEWAEFAKDKDRPFGYRPVCKECRRKDQLKRYCPTKERAKELKKKYGITMEQYDEMLVAQHHGCKICGVSPEEHGKNLAVDHCHDTGQIRGLLCSYCNTAIGLFKEDLANFRKAMQYLTAAQGSLEKPGALEKLTD
jgi:CRISPR/Cas system-associated protein Cas10 (large subunit of type III CRISPR-Cas system)